MHFIQFSFSNVYLYSPITWLHKIRTHYKNFIIFSILCIFPYFNISYILIITVLFLIIIQTLNFIKNYYHNCFSILYVSLAYLSPYCLSLVSHPLYKTTKIYLPSSLYSLLTKYVPLINIKEINQRAFFESKIPEFMIRIGAISILYSILLKTLLLTTMYEHIILSLCTYKIISNHYLKNIIIISCFASQFLEETIKYIQILYISIKLRNIHSIAYHYKIIVYYYVVARFLKNFKYNIYKVSSVLYSREFNDQDSKISKL